MGEVYPSLGSPTFTGTVTLSSLTASELVASSAAKALVSLAVATYPSLAELAYVKGVTSALQTQLGLKAPLASPTFTGTVTLSGALDANGQGITGIGNLATTLATAGSTNLIAHVHTDNTNAASHARVLIQTAGASGGDPYFNFLVSANTNWAMGIDNSDSDAFVISEAATVGTSNVVRIGSGGAVRITTLGAFVASDKYVVIDSSGNLHISALGPAS